MRKFYLSLAILMLFMFVGSTFAANLDDFDGPLAKMWTLRDPAKKSTVSFAGGNLVMALKAGADMYIKGTDAGVMILMDPPNMANFSVEMMANPVVKGTMPPACHIGIVFFNETAWVYSAWGPYNAGADIRLEDCINATYRWRDQTKIGIDPAKVAIDKDVYLKVVKTGNKLEFFAKGAAGDQWVSGGADESLGSNYATGKYKIGVIAKSWGGSVDSTFNFDYFNVPELGTTAVASSDKLVTTWAELKK